MLREHQKRPHNHPCRSRTCVKKFISETALEKHLQRKHKEFAAAKLVGGKLVFSCKLCDQVFDHHLSLQSHQHINHAAKCHVCDKQFVADGELLAHLRTKHNVSKEWKKWKKSFEFFLAATESDEKSEKIKTSILLTCIGPKGVEIYLIQFQKV